MQVVVYDGKGLKCSCKSYWKILVCSHRLQ